MNLTDIPARFARRAEWLEALYARFHRRELVGTDPLQVVYRFDDPGDREIVGLVAACLAYGNVKAILGGIEHVLHRLGPTPREFLLGENEAAIGRRFADFRYRVTSGEVMAGMLIGVRTALLRHGSLQSAFMRHDDRVDATVLTALSGFVDELTAGGAVRHLLADPRRGSACKRLMLYLRWMVRTDEIDPGGWHDVNPARLIIPLDTHMHRMARRLHLTRRRDASLKTAVEITDRFRQICPVDPLRYDFCLTRPGIMKIADLGSQIAEVKPGE
jgi:uncharacterized protein (TIGR02757 family)